MVTTDIVAKGLIAMYTIYAIIAMLIIAWFGYMVTKDANKKTFIPKSLFYSFFVILIIIGITLHLFTMHTLPWVKNEIKIKKPDIQQIIKIEVDSCNYYIIDKNNKRLPLDSVKPIKLKINEPVLFDVYSNDLTYGFGLFRKNHTLVFQMQVLPLYHNEIVWVFNEKGNFDLRSTEYAGPKCIGMHTIDFITIE
ncbi:MAG: hypothetical protein N3A01_07555 [Bacteroidales bacterium]|nr:hypothetical protein [Bacteroidales bacterium]